MFFIPIEFIPYQEGDENIYLGDENNSILGDMNQDGILNVLDVVILVNCVLANNCPEIANSYTSDVNSDGSYNVLDIVLLVNLILAS